MASLARSPWRFSAPIAAFAVLLWGCGGGPDLPAGEAPYKVGKPYQIEGVWYYPKADPHYDQTGIASWYGEPFHGRKTANGETYDMNALTAAHKTLPMPVHVKVTNLDNDRSLVLRVNDRGPFVAGRIIDVSRRAAQLLDFQDQGTARVRVQVVDGEGGEAAYAALGDGTAAPAASSGAGEVGLSEGTAGGATGGSTSGRFVQVGAYGEADNAFAAVDALGDFKSVQIWRIVSGGQVLYRVRLGPFASADLAEAARREVAARYPDAIVVDGP